MDLNWNVVIELVIGGLILVMLAGLGALAFRDWRVFDRLFWRVMLFLVVAVVLSSVFLSIWTEINNSSITETINELVDAGADLPVQITETVSFNRQLSDYLYYWILSPSGVLALYLIALYLFARPIPDKEEKRRIKKKNLESRVSSVRKRILRLQSELDEARGELPELEAKLTEKEEPISRAD